MVMIMKILFYMPLKPLSTSKTRQSIVMQTRQLLKIILVIIFSQLFLFISLSSAQGILVITNSDVTGSIDPNTISSISTAKKTKWDNGTTIIITMLQKGKIHERFAKSIVGLHTTRLIRIWRGVVFTGTGTPPRTFKTQTELVNFIATTPGSIGYISDSTPHENVKVVYDNRQR